MNRALLDHSGKVRVTHPQQKTRPHGDRGFVFEPWRLCGLTPLTQPLAELASFASGQSQTVGFVFSGLTLLSHGEPHLMGSPM